MNLGGKIKIIHVSIMLATMLACIGCSKDDDGPSSSIVAAQQTFTLNGLNNCNTSLGSGSTFVFKVPYTATSDSDINKIQVKTTVSDGGSETATTTQFTNENNIITWATCFRFGSQTWGEFEVVLEAQDGSKSNPTKVRINKPSGAN